MFKFKWTIFLLGAPDNSWRNNFRSHTWLTFDHIFPRIFMKWNTASMMNATMEKNPKALEERKIRHISLRQKNLELMCLYEHSP